MRLTRPRRRTERGITLVVTLLIIVALLGIGMAAIWMTSMGTRVATNLNSRQAALNAANAGIQHARQILNTYQAQAATLCPTNAAFPWSCVLAGKTNAKDDLPTLAGPLQRKGALVYDGTVPLDGLKYPQSNCAVDTDCSGGALCIQQVCEGPLGFYTVYARNDISDLNRAGNLASNPEFLKDTNFQVILRAEGRDPGNSATVVVEAAVSQLNTAVGVTPPELTFGKNIDQTGSNSIQGALKF